MPYFHKTTGKRIAGTSETCLATYPITRHPETGAWTYSGEEPTVWWETASMIQNPAGEAMFTTEDGEDVPESEIEWRCE